MSAQPLILLNGWPGVGKDTVAETLSLLIGDNKASLLDWGKGRGDSFQTIPDDDEVAQKAQRDACFADQVEHPSTFSKMIICTDCLSDTPLGRRLAQDFEVVAKRTNRLLIPIYLECQVEENMRRLQEAERRVSLKDKSKFMPCLLYNICVFLFQVSSCKTFDECLIQISGFTLFVLGAFVALGRAATMDSYVEMPMAVVR